MNFLNHVKFLADVLKANNLYPTYPKDYEDFIELLLVKYPDIMQSGSPPSRHICDFYLSSDPRKLGGRVVGPEGWAGSNNGGEKKDYSSCSVFGLGLHGQNSSSW